MTVLGSREGQLLAGKYKIEKLLGSGGMGQVYRAQNVLIGRTVAIKILNDEHARDSDIAKRFLREARAANLVRHENVVDVLDMGEDERGVPFIVQEYLSGEDLASRIDDFGGRLPIGAVLEILLPVVDAVGFAHTKGVVHRDLKPANVFLSRVGNKVVPKLLDFGISHMTAVDVKLTATGAAMGTPAYMSPEQVQAERLVDARSDVWALGVILYELISGVMPFEADNHAALFVKIATTDPAPLESLVPSVPPDLATIVHRCMKRDRSKRYPSAIELARDLRNVQQGKPLEVPASNPPPPITVVVAPDSPRLAKEESSPRFGAAPTLQAVAANIPDLVLPAPKKSGGTRALAPLEVEAAPETPTAPRPPSASAKVPAAAAEPLALEVELSRPPAARSSSPRLGPPPVDASAFGDTKDFGELDGAEPVDLKLDMPQMIVSTAPRPVALRPRAPKAKLEGGRIVSLLLWGLAVIGGLMALTAVNPIPGGWPVYVWAAPFFHDYSDIACAIPGAGVGFAGIVLVVRAFREAPVKWGWVISAAGLGAIAWFAVAPAIGYGDPSGRIPMLAPLGASLVPLGVGVAGLQALFEDWLDETGGRRLMSAVLAALGLFVSIQIVRAADAQPPPPPNAQANGL